MYSLIEDISEDANESVCSVLQHWEEVSMSEEDDMDFGSSIKLIPPIINNTDTKPIFIPESPKNLQNRQQRLTPKPMVHPPFLQDLISRYPRFVPASIPVMKKRVRPVCLYINYMGTWTGKQNKAPPKPIDSKKISLKKDDDESKIVSSHPSDLPIGRNTTARPKKRQRG